MEVDLVLTGVTGFVGRFVLLELLESRPETKIAVCIRPTKQYSAVERFQREILGSTLFAPYVQQLQSVVVLSAAIEDIETARVLVKSANHFIHCAANVKHYDPYDVLERDNVHNVQTILTLAESLGVSSLTVLSTCYVHPKGVSLGSVERIPAGTSRDAFTNDYAYTKWRGEEAVFEAKTTIPHIRILRLSCVGAPSRWDLLAHPCVAQAHLGVLSFACRGYLQALCVTQTSRISIVPVDIAAKAIVQFTFRTTGPRVELFQVCPPPTLEAFHFPLSLVFSILQVQFQLPFRGLVQFQSDPAPLPWWYWPLSIVHKPTRKTLHLHETLQEFVYTFSNPDTRFHSSLTDTEFPPLRPEEVAYQSCLYAARMSQHIQLERGVPLPLCDRFWHRMGGKEPVTACVSLGTPIPLADWPAYQTKMWSLLMGYRKCATTMTTTVMKNEPVVYADYFHVLKSDMETPDLLSYGLTQPLARMWKLTAVQEEEEVRRVLFQFDHGLMDGIGTFPLLQDIQTHIEKTPVPTTTFSARSFLPFWMDVWMGLLWLVLVLLALWEEGPTYDRSPLPTVDVMSVGVQKHDKFTFTGNLVWKLTQGFYRATKRTHFLFAVPVGFGSSRSPATFLRNDFVSVLLPVSSNMTEGEFAFRCSMLRSKTVAFLSWCLQQGIEWMEWDWLPSRVMSRVSAVVSSIQTGVQSTLLNQIHVATTTPAPIPFCVTAVTINGKCHLTARSHDPSFPAEKVLAAIKN